jgi:hypothetical protein
MTPDQKPNQFLPVPPTEKQVQSRSEFAQSRLIKTFFPCRVVDLHGGLEESARLIKEEGQTIIFSVAPHPGTGDIPRIVEVTMQNPVIRQQIQLFPIAVHMSENPQEGKVIHSYAERLAIYLNDLVTSRTKERFAGIYEDRAKDLFFKYMNDLMKVSAMKSFNTVFDQGDRNINIFDPPQSGAYRLIYRFAKKAGLVDRISFLFGYLENRSVNQSDDLHELDILVKNNLYTGQVVSMSEAFRKSQELDPTIVPEGQDPMDFWCHNQIVDIAREVGIPKPDPVDRVLYQANRVIYSFVKSRILKQSK